MIRKSFILGLITVLIFLGFSVGLLLIPRSAWKEKHYIPFGELTCGLSGDLDDTVSGYGFPKLSYEKRDNPCYGNPDRIVVTGILADVAAALVLTFVVVFIYRKAFNRSDRRL